jgi:hypothetical protein
MSNTNEHVPTTSNNVTNNRNKMRITKLTRQHVQIERERERERTTTRKGTDKYQVIRVCVCVFSKFKSTDKIRETMPNLSEIFQRFKLKTK